MSPTSPKQPNPKAEAQSPSRHQERLIMVQFLYQHFLLKESISAGQTRAFETTEFNFSDNKINFLNDLLAHRDQIISLIGPYLKEKWKFKNLAAVEKAILILAVYEVLYDHQPKAVAIDEAVRIAKYYCPQQEYKFINGLLEQVLNNDTQQHQQ